ncbi:hypothetical protein [Streptomyces sp. NBC_01451]|uniref:hypothetical protein n=1 Tax=Streptomyces sp. NBC_01451 TaxID=2903872 RepID=UPI002E327305|nr:hypothetical protein [Streptomyces sp. NBC_01451]
MNQRIRTLVPLTAFAASAMVSLLPGTATAQAAPTTTMVKLPAGYCCQELAPAGDSHLAHVLAEADLTVPADVSVGINCHPSNFTPEEHVEECDPGVAVECVADAHAGRYGLVALGCVPAGSTHAIDLHRAADTRTGRTVTTS